MIRKKIVKELEQLSPEELDNKISELNQEFISEENEKMSLDYVERMFYLGTGLSIARRDIDEVLSVYQHLADLLDQMWESDGFPKPKVLGFKEEIAQLDLTLTNEVAHEFATLHTFRDVLDKYDQLPEDFYKPQISLGLSLELRFQNWIKNGGEAEALEPETRQWLEQKSQGWSALAEKMLEEKVTAEDWKTVIWLENLLKGFYQQSGKPNDAIRMLKKQINDTGKLEDSHPADQADLLMDLGKYFGQFRKWSAAKRYFERALEIYRAQGEEFEMWVHQAEGWIDEANKNM